MAYRRSLVRTLGLSMRSSGSIGMSLGESSVADSSGGDPVCTRGGSASVMISMVI